MWDKFNREIEPNLDEIGNFVDNSVWHELVNYLMTEYQIKPLFQYSGCDPGGWNVKFRKAGRSLCTLYPMRDYFICLIVISQKEKAAFIEQLESFTPYIQELNEKTKEGMGQKWLMIEVKDTQLLPDLKQLLAIRAEKRRERHD